MLVAPPSRTKYRIVRNGSRGFDHQTTRMDERLPGRRGCHEARSVVGVHPYPVIDFDRSGTGLALECLHQLRNHIAQIADQRHVDMTVDADGQRIALDVYPFAIDIAFRPMTADTVMHRLADFGADGDDEVGIGDGSGASGREAAGKGAILRTFEIRAHGIGVDHRTLQNTRQRRQRIMRTRGERALPDEQDRRYVTGESGQLPHRWPGRCAG